jgi:hypothetical protein
MMRWPIGSPPSVRRSATWPTMPVPAQEGIPFRLRLAATSTASVADTPAASIKRVAGPTERSARSISSPQPTAGITTCQSRRYIVRGMESAWHEVGAQSAIVDSAIAGGEAARSRTLAGRE